MSTENGCGLLLILVILCFGYYTVKAKPKQTGGNFITAVGRHSEPHYTRQYRELDNVDNILNRPLLPVNKDIAALAPINVVPAEGPAELTVEPKTYLDFADIPRNEASDELKAIVTDKQPSFLGQDALIIDYDGEKFYWDWRFPKQPISVLFAADPEKYCREHPNEYPSYVIASRRPLFREPGQPMRS